MIVLWLCFFKIKDFNKDYHVVAIAKEAFVMLLKSCKASHYSMRSYYPMLLLLLRLLACLLLPLQKKHVSLEGVTRRRLSSLRACSLHCKRSTFPLKALPGRRRSSSRLRSSSLSACCCHCKRSTKRLYQFGKHSSSGNLAGSLFLLRKNKPGQFGKHSSSGNIAVQQSAF